MWRLFIKTIKPAFNLFQIPLNKNTDADNLRALLEIIPINSPDTDCLFQELEILFDNCI